MKIAYACGLGLILVMAYVTGYLSGGLACFVDIPSLLVVVGTCFGSLLCAFGFQGSLRAVAAIFALDDKDVAKLRKRAAKVVMRAGLFGGVFYMLMGLIAALSNLGDVSEIGPALATGLMALFYGSLIALLMVPASIAGE